MKAAQDWRGIHFPAIDDPVSIGAQADGPPFRRVRNSRIKCRMWPAPVVMSEPLSEDPPEVIPGQGAQVVEALAPSGPDGSLANRIGLWAPIRCPEHTQTRVRSHGVKLLREDPTPVVDEEAVGMVSRNDLTELLLHPFGCGVGRRIPVQDSPRPILQGDEDIDDRKVTDTATKKSQATMVPA